MRTHSIYFCTTEQELDTMFEDFPEHENTYLIPSLWATDENGVLKFLCAFSWSKKKPEAVELVRYSHITKKEKP